MSVVIIANGGNLRNAITQLEDASIGMTQQERDDADAFLAAVASCIKARCDDGTPFPIIE